MGESRGISVPFFFESSLVSSAGDLRLLWESLMKSTMH